MAYNVAANLRPVRPGAAFLDARDQVQRNALVERQVANAEQQQAFQQNRLTQADQIAADERAKVADQDEATQVFNYLSHLSRAKTPEEFSFLADRMAGTPLFQKHNILREDLTPEEVAQALPMFAAGANVAPAPPQKRYEERNGPRGSILQVDPDTGEMKQVVGPDNTESPNYGQPRAPSGYQFTPEGTLAAIPGGPADPNTKSTKDDSRTFAKADKLRDEFNAQSKDFITVGDSYNVVQETAKNPSAAGDLSMIFAYMKMLDPNSVVREQEFANAQNAAGVPERVANQYNRLLKGERLNPAQRADFIGQARNLFNTKKARQDAITKRYTEIAKRNGVEPMDVVGDLEVAMGQSAPTTAPTDLAAAARAELARRRGARGP